MKHTKRRRFLIGLFHNININDEIVILSIKCAPHQRRNIHLLKGQSHSQRKLPCFELDTLTKIMNISQNSLGTVPYTYVFGQTIRLSRITKFRIPCLLTEIDSQTRDTEIRRHAILENYN